MADRDISVRVDTSASVGDRYWIIIDDIDLYMSIADMKELQVQLKAVIPKEGCYGNKDGG